MINQNIASGVRNCTHQEQQCNIPLQEK